MARVSVVVTVRDATREGLRRVRNSINSLNRGILQTLSSVFSDGIGQGLAQGFQSAMSNPYVAAAVVALVSALMLQLGAALGGALVLAFGASIIGLGSMFAVKSKEIQRNWKSATKNMAKDMEGAAKPLVPVIHRAIHTLERVVKRFAPVLERAFKDAAPFLDDFVGRLEKGITEFGKRGFKPMMDAFNDLLSAINWVGFFKDLGDAFGNLGRSVSQNRAVMGRLFDMVLGLLPKAINLLAWFVRAWGYIEEPVMTLWGLMKQAMVPVWAVFSVVLKTVADIFVAISPMVKTFTQVLKIAWDTLSGLAADLGSVISPMWHGFLDGLHDGWALLSDDLIPIFQDFYEVLSDTIGGVFGVFLPGLDDMQGKGRNAGRTIKEWIIDNLDALGNWLSEHREDIRDWMEKASRAIIDLARWIKETGIPALIDLGKWFSEKQWVIGMAITGIGMIITAIDWARRLWDWFSRNWNLILAVTGIQTIIDTIGLVRRLWGWVQRNWNRNVVFRVSGITGVINTVKTLWGWVSRNWSRIVTFSFNIAGPVGTIKKLLGMAHGGVVGAATGGVRSNLTMVGEHGPELVRLPSGSHVRSNPDTRRYLSAGPGQRGDDGVLELRSAGGAAADLVLELLRSAVKPRGGNVQLAVMGRA